MFIWKMEERLWCPNRDKKFHEQFYVKVRVYFTLQKRFPARAYIYYTTMLNT